MVAINREALIRDLQSRILKAIETTKPFDIGSINIDFSPFSKSHLHGELYDFLSEMENKELSDLQDEMKLDNQVRWN